MFYFCILQKESTIQTLNKIKWVLQKLKSKMVRLGPIGHTQNSTSFVAYALCICIYITKTKMVLADIQNLMGPKGYWQDSLYVEGHAACI